MTTFISHNAADKATARALATLLVEQGENVWFDEWEIRPGESIVGGIEAGLERTEVFVLVWSAAAQASNWVGAELRAILRRRIDTHGLRIIPIMVDETPLPALVAEYRGFALGGGVELANIVAEMTGHPLDVQIAQRLQRRINELTAGSEQKDVIFGVLVCPTCGGDNFKRSTVMDHRRDRSFYCIECSDCGWSDWSE